MNNPLVWIVIGALIVALGIFGFSRSRKPRRPEEPKPVTLADLGLTIRSEDDGAGEVLALRQRLRVKVLHDEAAIDRLVAFERAARPGAGEAELLRAAIERWDGDNR